MVPVVSCRVVSCRRHTCTQSCSRAAGCTVIQRSLDRSLLFARSLVLATSTSLYAESSAIRQALRPSSTHQFVSVNGSVVRAGHTSTSRCEEEHVEQRGARGLRVRAQDHRQRLRLLAHAARVCHREPEADRTWACVVCCIHRRVRGKAETQPTNESELVCVCAQMCW